MTRIPLPPEDWAVLLSPRFAALGSPWQEIALALLGMVPLALVLWLYRRELWLVSAGAAALLLSARLLLIAALWCVVALQPMLARSTAEELPGRVVVCLDRSRSMNVCDPQRTPEERLQLAKALGIAPEKVDRLTRADIARAVLAPDGLDSVGRLARRHHVALFGFHKHAWETSPDEFLKDGPARAGAAAEAHFTNLRAPLVRALEKVSAGRERLLGVVVFTDGRHNWGETPVDVAAQFRRLRAPIYPVALGSRIPPCDLAVIDVSAPATVVKGADVRVEARVRASALPAQEIVVELLQSGKVLAPDHRRTIPHDGTDRRYALDFSLTPEQLGTQKIEVRVRPAQPTAEVSVANNQKSAVFRVAEDQARVLVIDGEARWEHHYLMNALRRDKTMQPEAVLFAPPRIGTAPEPELEKAGHALAHLPKWEKKNEPDPLHRYACIVLGDVSPEHLSPADRKRLERYVADLGGTLVLCAGKRWLPAAYVAAGEKAEPDPLARLLPIEDPRPVSPEDGFAVELTAEGSARPYLQMEAKPEESAARWAKLPRHYWGLVGKARPGAVVLAYVKPDQSERKQPGEGAADPQRDNALIALQSYGFGRVLYVGLDSTWRWRYRTGDRYHHRFWGQLIRWAAADKLLPAGTAQVRYGAGKPAYSQDEEVEVQVRLEAPLPPGSRAKVRVVRLDGDEEASASADLKPAEGQPLLLRASFRDLVPGTYRIRLDLPHLGEQPAAPPPADVATERAGTFVVLPSDSGEIANLATHWALLEALAKDSGGRVLTPDQVPDLIGRLEGVTMTRTQREEQKLWQDPPLVWYMLGLFLLLITVEWVARKVVGLP